MPPFLMTSQALDKTTTHNQFLSSRCVSAIYSLSAPLVESYSIGIVDLGRSKGTLLAGDSLSNEGKIF